MQALAVSGRRVAAELVGHLNVAASAAIEVFGRPCGEIAGLVVVAIAGADDDDTWRSCAMALDQTRLRRVQAVLVALAVAIAVASLEV